MSNLKRAPLLGGCGLSPEIIAKMAECESVRMLPKVTENAPRETRKERRARERYRVKMLKRESK